MQNEHLDHVLVMLQKVEQRVEDEIQGLTVRQLNWKPAKDSWSVAECLEHLKRTNQLYFPVLSDVKNHSTRLSWWAGIPGWAGWCSRILEKIVDPRNQRKVKTFRVFRPETGNFDEAVVRDFLASHHELISLVHELDGYAHHERIKVPSPVNRRITLTLKSVIDILWKHELRHLDQAARVVSTPGFPEQ